MWSRLIPEPGSICPEYKLKYDGAVWSVCTVICCGIGDKEYVTLGSFRASRGFVVGSSVSLQSLISPASVNKSLKDNDILLSLSFFVTRSWKASRVSACQGAGRRSRSALVIISRFAKQVSVCLFAYTSGQSASAARSLILKKEVTHLWISHLIHKQF